MAVVPSLGRLVVMRGAGDGAGRGRRVSWIALAAFLAVAPIGRAADAELDPVEWIAPPSLDEAPVRATIDIASEAEVPKPIVVPLPGALGPGAALLATLAAARWRAARRRRA